MWTALWTVLAVGVMVGIFAACVVLVVIGIRLYEHHAEKLRQRRLA